MSHRPDDLPDPDRLKALEEKIARAKAAKAPQRKDGTLAQGEVAWRMVIELVSGLGIGFGIGYGLDALFGTLPVFMVLFTLFGLAAGVRVMLRTAQELGFKMAQAQALAARASAPNPTQPAQPDGAAQPQAGTPPEENGNERRS
ncbi:AtpZ/AtpI family protein [Phaeovulum vinaykumarii]|uniref:ATP synthase protein I n=1 Tax=Phaeovulum vinaykumarii TaxID=407234 RepID=A0A1N7L9M8_9RHOB|nr:AtpZ/AtpI family protein [Phaeovulum vinaykumarii]SIS70529.1 ATP synthase protein I [Phaeovulum vinaykumarii]SOB98855.1 ATP synthase protein I [Phaeovulum vinaykumarii]